MEKLNELLHEYAQSIRRDDGTGFMHADAIRELFRTRAASARETGAEGAIVVPIELSSVAETLAEGDGFWRSCSGCHETNEGHETGHYPYSKILKCHLGGGCSECGGIGAVWDDTDYEAMGRDFERSLVAPSRSPAMAAQPVAAWLHRDDPRECISDAKKRDMIEHNGIPGRRAAEMYSIALGRIGAVPAMAAETVDWRELTRRLYVELFYCDQQMTGGRRPKWTQGAEVRDALRDAKAALEATPQPPTQADARKGLTDEAILDEYSKHVIVTHCNGVNVLSAMEPGGFIKAVRALLQGANHA